MQRFQWLPILAIAVVLLSVLPIHATEAQLNTPGKKDASKSDEKPPCPEGTVGKTPDCKSAQEAEAANLGESTFNTIEIFVNGDAGSFLAAVNSCDSLKRPTAERGRPARRDVERATL